MANTTYKCLKENVRGRHNIQMPQGESRWQTQNTNASRRMYVADTTYKCLKEKAHWQTQHTNASRRRPSGKHNIQKPATKIRPNGNYNIQMPHYAGPRSGSSPRLAKSRIHADRDSPGVATAKDKLVIPEDMKQDNYN